MIISILIFDAIQYRNIAWETILVCLKGYNKNNGELTTGKKNVTFICEYSFKRREGKGHGGDIYNTCAIPWTYNIHLYNTFHFKL